MGLDMYLTGKRYMSKFYDEGDPEKQSAIQILFPELEGLAGNFGDSPIKELSVEMGYWRKANAIHDWFVRNVQSGEDECRPHDVSREQLIDLKIACERVLDGSADAEDELPTANGFFFGGTDYGDYYRDMLKHTIKIVNRCLKMPKGWDFEYRSSW